MTGGQYLGRSTSQYNALYADAYTNNRGTPSPVCD